MEARNEVLARIVEIVASVEKKDARFISVATVLGSVLRRVLSTQKSSLAAAISLGQRRQMEQMCREMSDMIETLGAVLPERISLQKVPTVEEPSWWYALSETTHVLEESIDQLGALVKQQEKGSAIRDLTAHTVRLMRDHYNICLEQGRSFMYG